MCGADVLPPKTARARCLAVTCIVLGALNVLAGINLIYGVYDANWYLIPQTLAGVASIIAGSYVSCCCIANVEQTETKRADGAMQIKTARTMANVSVLLYFLTFIGAITGMLAVKGCADMDVECNEPCEDHWSLRGDCDTYYNGTDLLPSGCVKETCEEHDEYVDRSTRDDDEWYTFTPPDNYPTSGIGYGLRNCIAAFATSSGTWAPSGRCTGGNNLFVTTETMESWNLEDDGALVCAPLMCCTEADTPPPGYVTVEDFECGTHDNGCHWHKETVCTCDRYGDEDATEDARDFCTAVLPWLYGAIVWALAMFAIHTIFAVLVKQAAAELRVIMTAPGI